MDGAQVGVFKEADEVRFGRFLERQYGGALESQIRLEVLRDFAHETLERELADQEFRRLLVLAASSKRAIHHSLVSHSSFVLRAPQQISLILGLTRASRLDTHRISRSATVPGRYLCGFFTPANARAKLSRVSLRPPSRSRRPASRRQFGSLFPRHPRANGNE